MDELSELVDAALAWDGDADVAAGLRARAAALEPRPGRPPARGRAVARVVGLLRGQGDRRAAALIRWLADEGQAEQRAAAGPFLGDPALGPWPWEAPYDVDPVTAIATCEVLAGTVVVVDPALRRFVRTMVRERRRDLWRPAARALGRVAVRDALLREELREAVTHELPHHLARHLRVAQAAFVAAGGPADALPIASLPREALPGDDADQSVVLLATALLLEGPTGPSVVEAVGTWAPSMAVGPLSEEAARALLIALPPEPASLVRERLMQRRWRPHDADALHAWLGTAAWFHARGDTLAVARMREEAGPAARALSWTLGEAEVGPDELVACLQQALAPARWVLAPPLAWTVCIAETLALLGRAELAALPWASVEVACGLGLGGLKGPLGEVGAAGFALALGPRGRWLSSSLRRSAWPPEVVLEQARGADSALVTQVALQAERVLRELGDPAGEPVRFLWSLLLVDPPTRVFTELARVLRDDRTLPDGPGTPAPLQALVTAIRDLDEARDAGRPDDVIEARLRACLAETHARLAPALAARLRLDALDETLAAEASTLHPLLLGHDGVGGLLDLHGWLSAHEEPVLRRRRLEVELGVERVTRAQARLRDAQPWVGPEPHRAVVTAVADLEAALGLGWPLSYAPMRCLEAARAEADAARDEGRAGQAQVGALRAAMDRGDEDTVRDVVRDAGRRSLLPPRVVREVHRFLLDQLLWRDARRLRADVSERVALPSISGWLLPLLLAVCGGTFVVLDVGEAWLTLADRDATRRHHAATVALTLGGSYAVLLAALGQRLRWQGGSAWGRAAWRVAPLFLLATLLAGAASGLAIATLAQDPSRWPLWSSLSLFLGLFVGLVLQGQGLTRGDDDRGT